MAATKSPVELMLRIVKETISDGYDIVRKYSPVKSVYLERDLDYIDKRVGAEGIKFLTTTLPILGEWFDQVFLKEEEQVLLPLGFKPYGSLPIDSKPNVDVPLFLLPLWRYVANARHMESDDGFKMVRILRTICYGFKKLELPFEERQVDEKLQTFIGIETELSEFEIDFMDIRVQRAQMLMDLYLFKDWKVTQFRSKHGPGAVAGREKGAQKWEFSHYWHSVHKVFPAWDLWPLESHLPRWGDRNEIKRLQLASMANKYRQLAWSEAPVARLLFVPKDSRGPRIISCEPKELMYLQQGVASSLVSLFERHRMTRGHVNFRNQEINRELALSGSSTREWATLDLSDASDRVSCKLVKHLFPNAISRVLLALRSVATKLPDGTIVPLEKYAPMGSALCFPVESIVFWALCVAAVWEDCGDLATSLDSVYVYGDDIIVRTDYAETCVNTLELCCLKVNKEKSMTGNFSFRESCGMDAFKGHDVTPSRIRKLPPRRASDGTSLLAYAKYAENCLYSPKRSQACLDLVERFLGRIPRTKIPQQFLCVVDPDNYWSHDDYNNLSWNEPLSYYQTKLYQLRIKTKKDELDHWMGLQRSLIESGTRGAAWVVADHATLIRNRMSVITYLDYRG